MWLGAERDAVGVCSRGAAHVVDSPATATLYRELPGMCQIAHEATWTRN